jgi:hypothetical protein
MRRLLTIGLLCVVVSGCGPLSRAELSRGVETLSAVTAESQLVADGVAQDRTRATYVRVHARTLADDAGHEAEKLADASVEDGIGAQRDRAVAIAQRLDDTVGTLETHPGDERVGAEVHDELMGIADDLDQLTQRLEEGL